MYILSAERSVDAAGAFQKYREYLLHNKARFPKGAHALATSDWYFDPQRHECPHDAWLEEVRIDERSSGERQEIRAVTITARILGAYHDGLIEVRYPSVFGYRIDSLSIKNGHGDWQYDEFRVSDSGQLIHEIEWGSSKAKSSWLIVASDIEFRWTPTK